MSTNRIVALLTAAVGLTAAIAVPVANLDLSSTAGVLGGVATILAAALSWLKGWQAHEARQANPAPVVKLSAAPSSTNTTPPAA